MSPRNTMAYTTYANLSSVVQGKLEEWGVPTATRDADILKAATSASGIIHAHCVTRYAAYMPFAPVPDLIQSISNALTIYFLASSQQAVGESYRHDYEQALDSLKQINLGALGIFNETAGSSLNPMGENYGIITNTTDLYDDYEDIDRAFPITIIRKPPSTYPHTYREE